MLKGALFFQICKGWHFFLGGEMLDILITLLCCSRSLGPLDTLVPIDVLRFDISTFRCFPKVRSFCYSCDR